ncbi:MAG: aldo/keto reductase, partial [Planctomycetota bacterium]
ELGKTGHKVKLFGLGGGSTVAKLDERDEAVEIINKSLDSGVNYIDTSHIYGENGGSEKNIGEVMKDRRDEVFLASKTGSRDYDAVMRECETSLERLQTDQLDLYQHHAVDNDEAIEKTFADDGAMKAFKELHDQGMMRYFGVTGHSSRFLIKALERFDYDCVLISLNPADLCMQHSDYIEEFFELAREKEVGVIGMKVINKGSLLKRGITMEKAMRYTLSFPVSAVVVGITEPWQIEENVRIAKNFQRLDEQALEELEDDMNG